MKAARLLMVGCSFLSTMASAGQCRYSAAHYSSPDHRLAVDFIKIHASPGLVSNLAMRVRDESARRYVAYYYFDEGSAARIALISTTDVSRPGWRADPDGGARPHGTATFIGLSGNGRLEQTAPSSANRAPQFVIIPELGQLLKASGVSIRRNDAFTLTSCRPR